MSATSLARPSAIWLSVLLLVAMPVAIWLQSQGDIWTSRLVSPDWLNTPPRHSLLYTAGTFLPPTIMKDVHLTPADNPVLLTRLTVIPADVTVTIEPGTQIFTHEFAQLEVHGTLVSNGTATNHITIISNEQNVANQTWGGFLFMPGSHGQLQYITMTDGSPAISCFTSSQVKIADSLIQGGAVGMYVTSPNCHIQTSRIQGSRIGVITLPTLSPALNTQFATTYKDIQYGHSGS